MTNWIRLSMLAAALLCLGSSNSTFAQSSFSLNTLSGTYTFEESGVVGSSRFMSLGLLKLDGKGGITGTATLRTDNSTTLTAIVSGFYTVNSDGTGTLNLNFSSSLPNSIDPDTGETVERKSLVGSQYNFVIGSASSIRALRTDGGEIVSASISRQQTQ